MAKAKFDIKTEATRPLYVGVGVTDLAVEAVRDYVADFQKKFADVQKSVTKIDFQPQSIRVQATTVVNSRVDAVSKEAKARELGLTILDEAGFVTLLESGSAEAAPEA